MKKKDLSKVFDSDLQFLEPQEFDEVVMGEVELFKGDEFDEICYELQTWDLTSLKEMKDSLETFLITRKGKDLKLGTNLVLDHCVKGGKLEDFKVYLLTNTLEWLVSYKEFEAMKSMASFGKSEEQE